MPRLQKLCRHPFTMTRLQKTASCQGKLSTAASISSAYDPFSAEEELYAESTLLIVAGSDTSATALASTYFYLLHNPKSHQRVNEEIRSHFTKVEDIYSGLELDACCYLCACLDESLRLSPLVPSSLPGRVLHSGAFINNRHFPAGVNIGTSIYAIHHNAVYFPRCACSLGQNWARKPRAGRHRSGEYQIRTGSQRRQTGQWCNSSPERDGGFQA